MNYQLKLENQNNSDKSEENTLSIEMKIKIVEQYAEVLKRDPFLYNLKPP
jgi:hypothetical protein